MASVYTLPEGLPKPLEFEKWTPRVVTALGCNPGPFTLGGSNTFLVGTGKSRLLIDTGEGRPEYLDVLQRAMADSGCDSLQAILLTHHHMDHVGGIEDVQKKFGPVPVHKCHRRMRTVDPDEVTEDPHARVYEGGDEEKYVNIADGEVFRTEGATLTAHYTPGHCDDHMVFFLHEEQGLFSGDNVLGFGTTTFEDLSDYMDSLNKMLQLKPAVMYPNHGPLITNGCGKVEEYIKHRNLREGHIVAGLKHAEKDGRTALEIVKEVYLGLDPKLVPAAARNVGHHLRRLAKAGRVTSHVTESGELRWQLLKTPAPL